MAISSPSEDIKYSLIHYSEQDFMQLARRLRDIQDQYPNSFTEAVKDAHLGRRKAFALARVARVFDGYGISDARLNRIGWTKLNRISGHLDEHNAAELLTLAEERTVYELDALLKGEQAVNNAKVMVLYLSEADHARLCNALMAYGATPNVNGGLTGKAEALMKLLPEQAHS